jgi:hypothetical protein
LPGETTHARPAQPTRGRHRQQRADFAAAARLAKDRDVARVAAKARDIVAHPAECRDEIQESGVPGMRPDRPAEIGEIQKAKNVKAVVDADDDDIAATRQIGAVGHRPVARAVSKGAAMQPHHDRPLVPVTDPGCPYVQGQTVFSLGCRIHGTEKRFEHRSPLRAIGQLPRPAGIGEYIPHPGPGLRRLGGHEAVATRRRGAVRDALERIDAGARRSAQLAAGNFDDWR